MKGRLAQILCQYQGSVQGWVQWQGQSFQILTEKGAVRVQFERDRAGHEGWRESVLLAPLLWGVFGSRNKHVIRPPGSPARAGLFQHGTGTT